MASCSSDGNNTLKRNMEKLQNNLNMSNNSLRRVVSTMMSEMERGLTCDEASLKMLSSHVNSLPSFTKEGSYLAVDLGGTNFRILMVQIKENDSNSEELDTRMVTQIYAIPGDVLADAESFFDHIAECMVEFCKLNEVCGSSSCLPVGFTFSFPLWQENLNHAVLISWCKGFNVNGVVGKDVVGMLGEAIGRRNDINCEIVAVVNDTVGTMVSCALREPKCMIGLIIGNGCNACYMESVTNIPGTDCGHGQMCINMEWASFGDNGLLDEFRNDYDLQMDSMSSNPNSRTYEKMVSGRYLGELVRVVLCKLVSDGALFSGQATDKLFTAGSFPTSFVCQIENNHNRNAPYVIVQNIVRSFGVTASDHDCEVVKQICRLISTRAAHLCAAGVSAVALKIKANYPDSAFMEIIAAVDGTLYKKHPTFSTLLKEKVDELCQDGGVHVNFMPSYDGGGKGAALVAAAVYEKQSEAFSYPLHNALLLPHL